MRTLHRGKYYETQTPYCYVFCHWMIDGAGCHEGLAESQPTRVTVAAGWQRLTVLMLSVGIPRAGHSSTTRRIFTALLQPPETTKVIGRSRCTTREISQIISGNFDQLNLNLR